MLSTPSAAQALQSSGVVPHVVAWGSQESEIPAVVAAQFAHTFFSTVLSYNAKTVEAFAIASHITQAFFSTKSGDSCASPQLPQLLSAEKPGLPDNSSIPPAADIPGLDAEKGVAASIPGEYCACMPLRKACTEACRNREVIVRICGWRVMCVT